MKCYCVLFLIFAIVRNCYSVFHQHQQPNIVEVKEEAGPGGLWKTKMQWKAHWVKHWETRTMWIPVWRKVWGPVEVKEWIPFPKVPSTWKPPPQ